MKLICYVFDILILFSQCYKILTNKNSIAVFKSFFFNFNGVHLF